MEFDIEAYKRRADRLRWDDLDRTSSLGFGLPSSVEGDEFVCDRGAQIVGLQTPGETNGGPYLCQVLAAVGTVGQVMFETAPFGLGQRSVEVIGDEFDCCLTDRVASAQPHG
jgi:hypothetical protein